jgi:hypothetical protein
MNDRYRVPRSLLAAVCGLMAFAAFASDVDVADPRPFGEQRAEIVQELSSGEKYAEITLENRSRVVSLLDEMGELIDAAGSVQALSPRDKVQVFNLQEEANEILTVAAKDSRMVCRRERRMGSNMPVNQCLTAAMRRQIHENARHTLRHSPKSEGNPHCSGTSC